ncbi:hypothetical protein CEUSTIGMA_g6314.t1 [Chlamydomonas eustigma]|uniref:Reverse transcriptase Ty1/copia-type domain-containing protein n=1 Tax=Chlamydomonas eustigma TaxID=1157962 RepID=A0A250X733_9CHLO|nr:hypothetical protein CEUSTIGMA_g6314.t1 [Chlamydomonas eustigma]|eukprot:GAX78875.1 hypothetical protein CEUSTIGMA_g6314.t1 [Chlamydomonas eustigma]
MHLRLYNSSFLNVELDDEVHIRLPPEVYTGGDKTVYKLKKAVYGLKQAPRAWYNMLKKILTGLGFTQSEADPAMYFQVVNGQLEVILTHVDDLVIASADLDRVQWIKDQLKQQVDIKDMGPASYYLAAMEISRRDGRIHLTKKKYTKELLDRFAPIGLRGWEGGRVLWRISCSCPEKRDPISSARSKHIDTMHHFVRERIEMGHLSYQYISIADMVGRHHDQVHKDQGVPEDEEFDGPGGQV